MKKTFFTYYRLNSEEIKELKKLNEGESNNNNSIENEALNVQSAERFQAIADFKNTLIDENTATPEEKEVIICKADIKSKGFKRNKILIILSIISLIYVLLVSIPVRKEESYIGSNHKVYYYAILSFGEYIMQYWHANWGTGGEYNWFWLLRLIGIGILPLVIIYFIICAVEKTIAKQFSLYLTDKEINCTRKHIPLGFTIDKIDNIYVIDNLSDKIRGGKTVVISAASEVIKFHWVQNADEFVKKAWELIHESKRCRIK